MLSFHVPLHVSLSFKRTLWFAVGTGVRPEASVCQYVSLERCQTTERYASADAMVSTTRLANFGLTGWGLN